jgi:hypothetical protein
MRSRQGAKTPLGLLAPAKPILKASRDPNRTFNIKERTRRPPSLLIQLGFIDSENISGAFIQIFAMAAAGRLTNYRTESDRLSFYAGYDLKHLPGIGLDCFVIFIPDHLFCDEF